MKRTTTIAIKKARQEASQKRWQEKRKKQSWYLLKIAQERIAELEAEVARLSDVNPAVEGRREPTTDPKKG